MLTQKDMKYGLHNFTESGYIVWYFVRYKTI